MTISIEDAINADADNAYQYIELYRSWAEEDKLPNRKSESFMYEGDFWYAKGDLFKSTQSYQKGVNEALAVDPPLDSLVMHGYIYAAYNLGELNLHDEALTLIEKGLPYAKSFGDQTYIEDYYSNLGGTYYFQGNLAQSVVYFDTVLQINRQLGDTIGIVKAINNLGKINLRNDNPSRALDYLVEAETFQPNLPKDIYAILQLNKGDAYYALAEYDKASKHYTTSNRLFVEVGDTLSTIDVLLRLSRSKISRQSDLQPTTDLVDLSQYLNTTIPPTSKIDIHLQLARNNILTKAPSKAEYHLSQALELANEHDLIYGKESILSLLYDVNRDKQDFQKATYYNEQLQLVRDSINRIENRKEIELVNAKYDNQQKLKELAVLQDELITQQQKTSTISYLLLGSGALIIFSIGFLIIFFKKHKKSIKQKEAIISETKQTIKNLEKQVLPIPEITLDHLNTYLKSPLTQREYEIIMAVADGKSNKEIAEQLFVSVNTVKYHLKNSYEKMEVSNRVQATNFINNL